MHGDWIVGVSQKTPGQVDAETRRLVEEALDIVVTAGLAEIAANSIAMGLGC